MAIVGLPDKAVSEARERVRSALIASGLALPARRITVNLAPADLPKEGSHYDLPIALGLMAAIGAVPQATFAGFRVRGELGLDGSQPRSWRPSVPMRADRVSSAPPPADPRPPGRALRSRSPPRNRSSSWPTTSR